MIDNFWFDVNIDILKVVLFIEYKDNFFLYYETHLWFNYYAIASL